MNDRVSRPERVLFCTPFLILWVEEIFGNSGNDDFNYFLFYIVLLD